MAKKITDNSKKILVTQKGLQKLEEELTYLKDVKRKEVAERLKEAISYGDLSENSEYDEAKTEQSFVEYRISELQEQIKYAEVIKESKESSGIIQIGSTVMLKLQETGEQHEYTIVGSTEADPIMHKISNESPVGKAILGKKVKDTVEIKAPGGMFQYEIMNVA
jgi:transcription elongation factor GreA